MKASNTHEAIEIVAEALGDRAVRNASLGSLTTLRVGGPASLLVRAHSMHDLEIVSVAVRRAKSAAGEGVSILVIGQGSNLLVADVGFVGLVIVLDGEFGSWTKDSNAKVTAGAALKLPVLARQTTRAGLSGLGWMVGVPGSVGGAVRMNAGGHGSDVASSLLSVRVFDVATGEIMERSALDLDLGYRRSDLVPSSVVLDADFELEWSDDLAAAEAELGEIVRWRREHQPGGANCGSVFTNPAGDSAGRLIDACGLKGLRIGSAMVSEKHANFVQVDDGGSARDVWTLILDVRRRVFDRFGILLDPEVRTAGFDASLPHLVPEEKT